MEVLKGKETGPASMVSFITDCLLLEKVPFGKHRACLRVGLGWFEPESTEGILGLVSCPFPILVSLMAKIRHPVLSMARSTMKLSSGVPVVGNVERFLTLLLPVWIPIRPVKVLMPL